MILYKKGPTETAKEYKKRTIKINIDEKPERRSYEFNSNRERIKFIKSTETLIRSSMEYKEYIKFLKENMDMNRCEILQNISNENGKKYRIEIHHEPFTLYDMVDIEIEHMKYDGERVNPFIIADRVMKAHYRGVVGLIPLSLTQHKLVHVGKIFIPLQKIYHDYHTYFDENEVWIPQNVKDKIGFKVEMSIRCGEFQSNSLEPEFVYLEVDGFEFPNVPEEWAVALKNTDIENISVGK